MNLPSWIQMHGAVTHFPIALLIVGTACELWALLPGRPEGRRQWLRQVSLLLLGLAVVASLPSILTGYLHGRNYRFAPVQYDAHWKLGVVSTVLAAFVLFFRLARRDRLGNGARAVTSLGLLGATLVVGYTGHLGGEMVFGTEGDVSSAATPAPRTAVVVEPAKPAPVVNSGTANRLDRAAGLVANSAAKLEGASTRLAAAAARPTPQPAPVVAAPGAAARPASAPSHPQLDSIAARLEAAAARYERAAARLDQATARLSGKPAPSQASRNAGAGSAGAPVAGAPPAAKPPTTSRQFALDPTLVRQGAVLVASDTMDCLSCHKLAGKGGRSSTALEGAGTRNPDPEWQLRHLKNPESVVPGSKMPAYDWEQDETLKEAEVRAMAHYLASLK